MKRISIEAFGRDHWSTLAYIETVCVDNSGVPARDRMRVNQERHPGLVGEQQARSCVKWQDSYSTRLKGNTRVKGHDDWDVADDLAAAGLIEINGTGLHPVFKMTDFGHVIAGRLRIHKANGGNFANFVT